MAPHCICQPASWIATCPGASKRPPLDPSGGRTAPLYSGTGENLKKGRRRSTYSKHIRILCAHKSQERASVFLFSPCCLTDSVLSAILSV